MKRIALILALFAAVNSADAQTVLANTLKVLTKMELFGNAVTSFTKDTSLSTASETQFAPTATLKAYIDNHSGGGSGAGFTGFISAGAGNPPAASPVGQAGKAWINNALGEVWTSNGSAWRYAGILNGDKGDITVANYGQNLTIDNSAITTAKIASGAVDSTKIPLLMLPLSRLHQSGATIGQVPKWDGAKWIPGTDNSGAGSTFANEGLKKSGDTLQLNRNVFIETDGLVNYYEYYLDSRAGNNANSGLTATLPKSTIANISSSVNSIAAYRGQAGLGLSPNSLFREQFTVTQNNIKVSTYGKTRPDLEWPAIISGSDIQTSWTDTATISKKTITHNLGASNFQYDYLSVIEIDTLIEKAAPFTARTYLNPAATLAACLSTPGTFFHASNASPVTLYVHATTGNPNSNGRRYEVATRNACIYASGQSGITLSNLIFRDAAGGYGMLGATDGGLENVYVNKVVFQGGVTHSTVTRSGIIENSVYIPGSKNVNLGHVFYESDAGGNYSIFRNNTMFDYPYFTYAHQSGGGSGHHRRVVFEGNNIFGNSGVSLNAFAAEFVDTVQIAGNYVENCQTIFSGIPNYLIVRDNIFKNISGTSGSSGPGSWTTKTLLYNNLIKWTGTTLASPWQSLHPGMSTNVRNNIIHVKNTYTGESVVFGRTFTAADPTDFEIKYNIFISEQTGAGLTKMGAVDQNSTSKVTAGWVSDRNVYIIVSGSGFRWTILNPFGGVAINTDGLTAWKAASTQDSNSIQIDLRSYADGLKRVFVDPDRGDYTLTNSTEANQIRALFAGMTSPPTSFVKRPTYEQAARHALYNVPLPTVGNSPSGFVTATYRKTGTDSIFYMQNGLPVFSHTAFEATSQTANKFLGSPVGGSGIPSFRTLLAADIVSAGGLTGSLTANRVLYSTGTSTAGTSGNFTFNGSALGISADLTWTNGIKFVTSNNNNPWIFTVGDSYNLNMLADGINFFGSGINFSGMRIGSTVGFFGINKSAIGSIVPANSVVMGGVSPGARVAMLDYSNQPIVSVLVNSATQTYLDLNLGYNGWASGVGNLSNTPAGNVPIKGPLGTGTGTAGDIIFQTGALAASGATGHTLVNRVAIQGNTGNMGLRGNMTPTAALHPAAGSTAAGTAPLKFTLAGAALLATKESGAVEAVGNNIFYTDSTLTRHQLTYKDSIREMTALTVSDPTVPFVATGAVSDGFWRVPSTFNGWKLEGYTVSLLTAGAVSGSLVLQVQRTTLGGSSASGCSMTFATGDLQKDVTGCGLALATGDMLRLNIGTNDFATPAQGVVVTYILRP